MELYTFLQFSIIISLTSTMYIRKTRDINIPTPRSDYNSPFGNPEPRQLLRNEDIDLNENDNRGKTSVPFKRAVTTHTPPNLTTDEGTKDGKGVCCSSEACYPCPYPLMPYPMMPAPMPMVVPAQAFFEPVIHNHPPLHKMRKLLDKDRRKRRKYRDYSWSSSSDTDTTSSESFDSYDD